MLKLWLLVALSAIVTATTSPTQLLADARDKLEQYETLIIHTYLARFTVGTLKPDERDAELTLFSTLGRFYASNELNASTRNFSSFPPYPPALTYGVETNIASFYHTKIATDLAETPPIDLTTTALLDVTLLNAISHRIRIGSDVAYAKYLAQRLEFCTAIRANDIDQIRTMLTNQKQVDVVLSRVEAKTNAWSTKAANTKTIVTLFKDFLIPITTQLEVQTVLSYSSKC